jgi:hypothetical protein
VSIQELGWRQGSVLEAATVQQLPEPFVPPLAAGDFVLVISQSCDVVHPSYELEPTVEMLAVRAIPDTAKDGNLFFAKNPRKLQFQHDGFNGAQLYEISIHERVRTPRPLLEAAPPSASVTLDPDLVDLISRWVGKRYTRAAFPDTFNKRCSTAAKDIRKALKQHGHLISGVFVRIDPLDEAQDDQPYSVILVLSMRPEVASDEESAAQAAELCNKLEALLAECEGVEVVHSSARSEEEISLHDLRELARWDYDYLSAATEDLDEIAPDDGA